MGGHLVWVVPAKIPRMEFILRAIVFKTLMLQAQLSLARNARVRYIYSELDEPIRTTREARRG
jgi:hypothetical protein